MHRLKSLLARLVFAGVIFSLASETLLRAETPRAGLPSLGPGLMIRIATKPLLLAVERQPKNLRLAFAGKGTRLRYEPRQHGVFRPVLTSSVPKEWQGLPGERVNLYAGSGNSCGGTIRGFVFVNRYDESETRPADPAPGTPSPEMAPSTGDLTLRESKERQLASNRSQKEPPIPDWMWNLKPDDPEERTTDGGALTLAVRVEPDPSCVVGKLQWGRLASLPIPDVYTWIPADQALKSAVTRDAVRLFAANRLDPIRCEGCKKGVRRWKDYVQKNLNINVFQSQKTGRRIISAHAGFRDEAACSMSGSSAFFESNVGSTALRLARQPESQPSFIRAAADLDGDGWPELVVEDGGLANYIDGTVLLFNTGGRYDRSESLLVEWACGE